MKTYALVFFTDTESMMILNGKGPKKRDLEWMSRELGEFCVFIGWL